jgi:UPF0716 family protein affecting phage T7 exclusion
VLRLASLAGGLCLVIPGTMTDIIGIAVIAVVVLLSKALQKKTAAA